MASTRYRVLQPAEHLAALGHRIDIIQAGESAQNAALAQPLAADVVVVSKGMFDGSVALAQRAKALGAKLLVDLCDDHFGTQFRGIYLALCQLADGIVASTPEMAGVITQHTGRTAVVVSDPYEAPWTEPRLEPRQVVQLAWFGHPTNFDTLTTLVGEMPGFVARWPVHFTVVSTSNPQVASFLRQWQSSLPGKFSVQLVPWSADATWQALRQADAVVIPSLAGSAKAVKSPNRLIESLRMGRFVAAYPLPAYQQFAEYAWLGERVLDGVTWALNNRATAIDQVRRGQEFVSHAFAPARIAAEWHTVLGKFASIANKPNMQRHTSLREAG
jgi:hypothetical protein